ncbi:RagB/SusD family nutrient uptake outer membrane protein [Belliella marina]|uniref:RagB/SusD family nutrient uptake outer membrane protein n=1 Tax=Belliella marina TaxID=1644146 RepID=A0ABW4VUD7_9BACT
MKRLIKNILIKSNLALGLAISVGFGCDGFLDPEPQTEELTKDIVFGDILQAEKVLNNVYSFMTSGLSEGAYYYAMLSSVTDESVNSFNWAGSWSVTNGAWTPVNQFDNRWNSRYQAIRRANLFLENIDVTPGNEPLKTRMKAEARYLRAFYYFELVQRYGGVPLVTELLSLDGDLLLPRNTMEECINFIVSECDAAADVLPIAYGSGDLGRVTKGTAMALKSRVLLLYASPLHNPSNEQGRWQAAANAAKAVIDMGVYELYPDYQKLFYTPFNKEVIFARENYGNTFFDNWNRPSGNIRGGWGGTNPTVNFVESYDMENGLAIDDPASGYDEGKPFDNRDPRLYQTVVTPGSTWFGDSYEPWIGGKDGRNPPAGVGNAGDGTWTGMNLKKFLQENFQNNTRTWIIFRLGEMYLNHAEALNEAQGPVPAVYDALDMLRSRPTVGLPPLARTLSKEQMRERIRKERQVELAFEEHRWFDVKRWQIGEQVLDGPAYGYRITRNGAGDLAYEKFVFQQRRYVTPTFDLYPIPQSEININKNLEQNPGW